MTLIVWLFLCGLVAYLLIASLMYVRQRRYLYFPTRDLEVQGVESIHLDNQGVRLKVWVLKPGCSDAVIYFGGNAEQVIESADCLGEVIGNRTLYLLDYRGYGGSTGSPDEQGFYSDALYLADYVLAHHTLVTVVGRSLGSAMATHVTARRNITRLVLITPFDSILRIAQEWYPWLPVSWLLRDRFESWRDAAQITTPVGVILVKDDHIVPNASSGRLLDTMKNAKLQTVMLVNGNHNYIEEDPEYGSVLQRLLNP